MANCLPLLIASLYIISAWVYYWGFNGCLLG